MNGRHSVEELKGVLAKYWGYGGFLPLQEEAMTNVLNGCDSVVVLPTGGGKSLCFQAPALLMRGVAVIVSPLISLMKDQVDALTACGVPAGCLNSSLSADARRLVAASVREGEIKLLYVAPERLVTSSFLDFLATTQVAFFAIDEAHCISHWGHDFRPEYRELCVLKEAYPDVAVHAYTATATERVRDDIVHELRLRDARVLVGSFDRPNLIYRVARRETGAGKLRQLTEVIDRHRSEAGIIYCITRKEVDSLSAKLRDEGYRAVPYHAGLSDDQRRRNQDAFVKEEADIVVATVAFGMGIDKSNVRYVMHTGMPKSLECYQQESGRAGRDGLEAECSLFFSAGDYATWLNIIEGSETETIDTAREKLNDMYAYAAGVVCRHTSLAGYFGETLAGDGCGACDVCLGELDLIDDSMVVGQKILSCVVRLGQRFGAQYTTAVLRGSKTERIRQRGHDQLSTYGILGDHTEREIRDWTEQLVAQGYLEKRGDFNVLSLTAKGWRLIRGQETPRLLRPARKPDRSVRERGPGIDARSWEGVDRDLFEALRGLRREIARSKNVPAYVVVSDATLRDVARTRPTTRERFLQIYGIGEKKCAEYGDVFLPFVGDYCRKHSVATDVDGRGGDGVLA